MKMAAGEIANYRQTTFIVSLVMKEWVSTS